MSLFENIPRTTPTSGATVSSAAPEASLGFWQRNRKGAFLIGGCLVLLLASRAYTGRAREAKKEAKIEKVSLANNRDEADKDSAIAGLKERFAAEQQKREAQEQTELVSAMAARQLTAAQLEALAGTGGNGVAGVASVPGATVAVANTPVMARERSYNSAESGTPAHVAERPATLVISYREQGTDAAASPVTQPVAEVLPAGYPPPPTPAPAEAAEKAHQVRERAGVEIEKGKANPEDGQHALAAAAGEKFRIREGTWIPCTEELRINGSFASDIDCLVSIPIYSVSGARLLIPQGTLALSHVASVGSQNQQRLFVVFDRFIMPDGYTVNYDNATGLDQIGQTGLRDQVNHHYMQMFGASVAIAAIGGLAQIGNYGNSNVTASSQYRSGLTQGMSESSTQILNRFSSVLPTFVIREGARNNIHLPFNLWLPDYTKHQMGGEL